MKLSDKEFNTIQQMVYNQFGIALTDRKRVLIESRFSNTLNQRNINSFTEYFDLLNQDKSGTEMIDFVNRITTNHTYFFREEKHFQFLREIALPEIILKEQNSRDLRIWSAGCSSGEEPYSIAMLLDDYFGEKKRYWDTKILATDISTKVLNQAHEGKYPLEQLNKLKGHFSQRYFIREGESCKVHDLIKNEIIFRKFNLTNQFAFKKQFHVIFCRNVMIYFDKASKEKLIRQFYNALVPGGYLFIGHSETIENRSVGFKFVEPAIYKKE